MEQKCFEELVANRKRWVETSKENKFDFDAILAGMYNNPSHFIYELIQNAEDVKASKISFALFYNRLEVRHNGAPFSFQNVDAITGIGISTKKDDINLIGKFGVGFKSVFAVTKSPAVYSGIYNFCITDFVVPQIIKKSIESEDNTGNSNTGESKDNSGNEAEVTFGADSLGDPKSKSLTNFQEDRSKETLFVLPFNHPSRDKSEVFEIVERKLKSIGLKTLLFLNHIEEIRWETPEKSGHYYKEAKTLEHQRPENVRKVSIIARRELIGQSGAESTKRESEGPESKANKQPEEYFEEYLVISKALTAIENTNSTNLAVEIAYKLGIDGEGNETIVKEQDSKLVVFFPTEKVTYLDFLVQGPYRTTPNRENIPLDDHENLRLIEETAALSADTISIVKELGLLNISFLQVLPLDESKTDETLYLALFQKVKEKLLSQEPLLPSYSPREAVKNDNYANAEEALLVRGGTLTELLNKNDLPMLFGRAKCLDANITLDKTRQLHKYLIYQLNIKEVDFNDFAKSISSAFMATKSDSWVMAFYGCLLDDHRSLWEKRYGGVPVLKRKPIIRLSDDTHVAPFDDNGRIHVYLPVETETRYRTVKRVLTTDEKAITFLREIGLTEPDIFAEIKEFILPKYQDSEHDTPFNEYIKDIGKLVSAFTRDEPEKKLDLVEDLKNTWIIRACQSRTADIHFCKPTEVYLNTNEMVEYFKGFDHVFFVSDELQHETELNKGSLADFLLTIGCEDKPRRIEIEPTLTKEDKRKLRKEAYSHGVSREFHVYDYDYQGLDNFLNDINAERSVILWDFLLKSISNADQRRKSDFFYGEYSWFYYAPKKERFEAKFLKTLKSEKWLFTESGQMVASPEELCAYEISDAYTREAEWADKLTKVLGFKSDEIKRIEKETGGKFLSKAEKDEYEEFQKNKRQQEEKNLLQEGKLNVWAPEVEPNASGEIEHNIVDLKPESLSLPDLRGQSHSVKQENIDTVFYGAFNAKNELDHQSKDIGRWGESFVFSRLKKQYPSGGGREIVWLNEQNDSGKGYDLVLLAEGAEIEYIEVKSKIDGDPRFFEISGTQWEFARFLYHNGQGETYKIYLVSNAGKRNASISVITNPVKLWKENKLFAHPIRVRL